MSNFFLFSCQQAINLSFQARTDCLLQRHGATLFHSYRKFRFT
jgi:hypothetical protein